MDPSTTSDDRSQRLSTSSAGVPPSGGHSRRSALGTTSLLSRIQAPFARSSADHNFPTPNHQEQQQQQRQDVAAGPSSLSSSPAHNALANALNQQKTRRRKGSLRKVALLGRGAQRERRESKNLTAGSQESSASPSYEAVSFDHGQTPQAASSALPTEVPSAQASRQEQQERQPALNAPSPPDVTPWPSMTVPLSDHEQRREREPSSAQPLLRPIESPHATNAGNSGLLDREVGAASSTATSYSPTTTDDEDGLHIARLTRPVLSTLDRPSSASGSESNFGSALGRSTTIATSIGGSSVVASSGLGSSLAAARVPLQRRRSLHRAKSPLALTSLATLAAPLPHAQGSDAEWDYSETEWWGWVVLFVTWIVFVTGMGSCLGVWSWAWDVGTTPYAPPELEDDPTLPIVGYYPALIILTGVMAWVWVVIAWIGMKYFRHAKISGD